MMVMSTPPSMTKRTFIGHFFHSAISLLTFSWQSKRVYPKEGGGRLEYFPTNGFPTFLFFRAPDDFLGHFYKEKRSYEPPYRPLKYDHDPRDRTTYYPTTGPAAPPILLRTDFARLLQSSPLLPQTRKRSILRSHGEQVGPLP